MRLLHSLLPFVAMGFSGCIGLVDPAPKVPQLSGTLRVLFVGNSHSYEQDLSGMVQAVARQAGNTNLLTARVAFANYALEDHAYEGTAVKALERSNWEYVVMQQGPSSLESSQQHLGYWSQWWQPRITAAQATPVLFQIWPSAGRRGDAANALLSYANAAALVGGILAPAGDAFTAALEADGSIGVYSPDGLHASRRGAYLAALVIVGRILELDVETLPPEIPGASESPDVVRALQRAAAAALARNPARPGTTLEARR
jgi:hypothetical protein